MEEEEGKYETFFTGQVRLFKYATDLTVYATWFGYFYTAADRLPSAVST